MIWGALGHMAVNLTCLVLDDAVAWACASTSFLQQIKLVILTAFYTAIRISEAVFVSHH